MELNTFSPSVSIDHTEGWHIMILPAFPIVLTNSSAVHILPYCTINLGFTFSFSAVLCQNHVCSDQYFLPCMHAGISLQTFCLDGTHGAHTCLREFSCCYFSYWDFGTEFCLWFGMTTEPVSYTHLDVYKRQVL